MTPPSTRHATPPGFLSDTQRPPARRTAALREIGTLLARRDPASLFRAGNLLALVLFRSGAAAEARALCRQQLRYAAGRRGTPEGPRLTALSLQPQINLIRLKGYDPARVDEALRDLAALEPVSLGRGAGLPDLSLDGATVRRLTEDRLLDPVVVRNVVVQDTCLLLWRHRRDEQLLTEAARLRVRWPALPPDRIVQHAAEAPWLVAAPAQPEVPVAALDRPPATARRLAYVCLLHRAAHAAGTGDLARAGGLAEELRARRGALRAPFASPVTPLRWLATLATVLERAERAEAARALRAELVVHPDLPADPALDLAVRTGLGLGPRPVAPDGDAAPALGGLTASVRERLAEPVPV